MSRAKIEVRHVDDIGFVGMEEKMMDDLKKACVLHEDLYKKLVIVVYQLCEWGVPVSGALEVGRAIIDNYWREKNADKSGG